MFRRVILIVLDSVGIGEMPDADRYGDQGSDTLGHLFAYRPLQVPNLRRYGIANIKPVALPPVETPQGAFGRAAIASAGKDTTTGHWEIAGIITDLPFPTYPNGFPPEIIEAFERAIGRKVLGNKPASGTEIIRELGEEHMRTGRPIVYTSADSVFQIAAHEEIIPREELYRMCEIARRLLDGPHRVGRVIARPFIGTPGNFRRTEGRRDYAVDPPSPTLLDLLKGSGWETVAVGKTGSIFNHRGFTREIPAGNNMASIESTLLAMRETDAGLIFTNLVDFDMLYGHRNDVEGYARALEAFDARLPEIEAHLREDDLLLLTADHGCDPTTPSTDHSREYVPILAYGARVRRGVDLGIRRSLADIGQTIAENFGLRLSAGESFLAEIAVRPRAL
ncbi:MAG: phosphopentomutase [Blastocatellia bacterium]|nr:phosphopentomutase [Blastocatellia bacterium]MCS7158426.1 phosphopentomutase [Blastocatellia bacterium]MCX7752932.1 phosphopentomutase [Blastocatellia bacterium]MDW8167988.1 phosphopentomutase [Acidobacteriota bacterium]MDW8256363.1 phosphopentomutase [Acidobacteriota bacterium]